MTPTRRYQNAPEVLEAYVQMARAYRRLGRVDEARGTLEQAKVVLARMKSTAEFSKTTNRSEEEWAELLDWMSRTQSAE